MGKQKHSSEVAAAWAEKAKAVGHCGHAPHCLGIGVMDDRDPLGCCHCGDRLIAAAPDLLAACEAALAYDAGIQTYAKNGEVNLRDDGSGYAQGADLDAPYGAFVSAARAAIAKARGES